MNFQALIVSGGYTDSQSL